MIYAYVRDVKVIVESKLIHNDNFMYCEAENAQVGQISIIY
jgi:ABC-type xylose transport system substrate-binding protein